MLLFGVCFVLYFIKLSAGKDFCIISSSHFAIGTIFCLVTIDHTHNDVT